MVLAITSSSVNRDPSNSAAMSASISPGPLPSRPRIAERKYAVISCTLWSTRAARSGLCWKLPSISAKSADQALSCWWSAIGTPSISAVTIAGIGLARSAMTSIPPLL